MTAPSQSLDHAADVSLLTRPPTTRWGRVTEWITSGLSSISVKEARQALKSSQFVMTYSVLVVAVAVCTIGVFSLTTFTARGLDYEETAKSLFLGYLMILGVPLGIVIPFSAYRSLSREYEDGTIELISITTMKPYQVVLGKFGTSMLQLLIYLSVIAPCIAMTYMLEGITVTQILLLLGIAVGGCICLTTVGLFLAGASRSYGIGLAVSTLFVLALGGLYLGWISMVSELARESFRGAFSDWRSLVATFGMVGFFGSSAILVLVAAATQISFDSDNRSTAIRLAILFQLFLFVALIAMLTPEMRWDGPEISFYAIMFADHYWLILGCLMVGESNDLSRRVQRHLPRSGWGKSLLGLLMPGPGRGYLFAIAGMLGTRLAILSVLAVANLANENWLAQYNDSWRMGRPIPSPISLATAGELVLSSTYMMAFPVLCLSLVFLVMKLVRRQRGAARGAWGPALAIFLGAATVLGFTTFSYFLWEMQRNPSDRSYFSDLTILNSWNWYVSMDHVIRTDFVIRLPETLPLLLPFLMTVGVCLVASLVVASRELAYRPVSIPHQVIEEEQRLREARMPDQETIDDVLGKLDEPPQIDDPSRDSD